MRQCLTRKKEAPEPEVIRGPDDMRKIMEDAGMIVIQHDCGPGVFFFERVPDSVFEEIEKSA
jgi:hypothetical protein